MSHVICQSQNNILCQGQNYTKLWCIICPGQNNNQWDIILLYILVKKMHYSQVKHISKVIILERYRYMKLKK